MIIYIYIYMHTHTHTYTCAAERQGPRRDPRITQKRLDSEPKKRLRENRAMLGVLCMTIFAVCDRPVFSESLLGFGCGRSANQGLKGKGTNGVSTNGVTAKFMFLDRLTFVHSR